MNPGITLDEVSVTQAILKVGGRYKAQICTLLIAGFALMHGAILVMGLPLIIYVPDVLCQNVNDSLESCSVKQACSSGHKFVFSANEERSAVYEWALICENAIYTVLVPLSYLFGSCYIGLTLGSLLAGQFGDTLGRKKTLMWLLLCSCVCEFVLYCAASVTFFTVVFFFLGLFGPAAIMMPMVLIAEITDKRARGPFLTVMCLFWIIGTASAYSVSYLTLAWRPIVLLSLSSGIIFFIFSSVLKESPRFYAANLSRYQRAREVFLAIATRNRKEMFVDKLIGEKVNEYDETGTTKLGDERKVQEDGVKAEAVLPPNEYIGSAQNAEEREKELSRGQTCSYLDLVKFPSIRMSSVRVCVLASIVAIDTCAILTPSPSTLELRYLSKAVAIGVAFASLLFVTFTTNFAGRKLLCRFALIVIVCVGVARLVVTEVTIRRYLDLGHVSACSIAVAVVSGQIVETAATPVRCLVLGAAISLGVVVWTATQFTNAYIPSEQHSSSLLIIANTLGLVATWRMRETAKKGLKDFIEEIMQDTHIPMVLGAGDQSSDPKRPPNSKGPKFDALNEEVRGLD